MKISSLEKLRTIMRQLRAPKTGCPWDLEQDYQSIVPHTLEEVYEVIEAIDNKDWPALKDELGDLLLQIAFYVQFAEEDGHFTFEDVIQNLNEKMIRRHPHVFADVKADNPDEVIKNWNEIKAQEKPNKIGNAKPLDGIQQSLPALIRSEKIIDKAIKVGFDWPNDQGVFDKVSEELLEVKEAIEEKDPDNLELEIGDVLFSVSVLARRHNIHPERALQKTMAKFTKRFNHIHQRAQESNKTLDDCSLEEMDAWWQESKRSEK